MAGNRIVLDSGVLSTLAEKDGPLRIALREAIARGTDVLVPTAVIAESTSGDGRRDAIVNRTLKLLSVIDLDHRIARSAAALRHARRLRAAGTIDAIVVATADLVPGTRLLTGDPDDLRLLASINGRTRVVALTNVEL